MKFSVENYDQVYMKQGEYVVIYVFHTRGNSRACANLWPRFPSMYTLLYQLLCACIQAEEMHAVLTSNHACIFACKCSSVKRCGWILVFWSMHVFVRDSSHASSVSEWWLKEGLILVFAMVVYIYIYISLSFWQPCRQMTAYTCNPLSLKLVAHGIFHPLTFFRVLPTWKKTWTFYCHYQQWFVRLGRRSRWPA